MKHLLVPQLKKLVSIDTSIRSLMKQIETTTKVIDDTDKALKGAEKQIELLHQEKNDAKKKVSVQEIESQFLQDQEVAIREHLNAIKSTKEYELKNKELINVSKKRLLLDDVIIKVWHDLDIAETKLKTTLPEYITKKDTLTEEKIELGQTLNSLTEQLGNFEKERVEASKVVPENWLAKYTRMRLLVDDPIVPVSSTHCSACFYGIPRQEISNLKRDALIICRNCYRFLHQEEPKEKKEVAVNQSLAETVS